MWYATVRLRIPHFTLIEWAREDSKPLSPERAMELFFIMGMTESVTIALCINFGCKLNDAYFVVGFNCATKPMAAVIGRAQCTEGYVAYCRLRLPIV